MDNQRAARVATFAVGIAVASYAAYQLGKLVQRKRHETSTTSVELRPPFPEEVVQLLRSSVLCYLSTLSDGAPHLSLMNFTYCPADEKIIMSTRRDTTKYRALLQNKRVAVLIHDFPDQERERAAAAAASAKKAGKNGNYAQTYSVTLYGSVQVETGAAAGRYRALHLERNANQRQFIVGDNIGILTVLVDTARICNQQDQVHSWEAKPVVRSPSDGDVDSPE